MSDLLQLTVNGQAHQLEVPAGQTLLNMLRDQLSLTGTKRGCDIGACGACTVLLDGNPVLSCMTLAVRCHEMTITTVEGLASNGHLHPLQQAAIDQGAVQCGFCTPGWLLSAKALLERNPDPTRQQVKEAISGNFCRCTGYQKIVDAVMVAATMVRQPVEAGS